MFRLVFISVLIISVLIPAGQVLTEEPKISGVSGVDGATWEETSMITNGGFEIPNDGDYSSEWEISIAGDGASGYGYGTEIDEHASNNTTRIFNYYNDSVTQPASFPMNRTVEDVPADTYKLRFEEEGGSGNIRS